MTRASAMARRGRRAKLPAIPYRADLRQPVAVKALPQSSPCPACSAPVEPADAFCPACGAAQAKPSGRAETAPLSGFRCENCGAQVRCEPGSRTTSCPFCAAPYVVELSPEFTGKQDPEFVIGFAVS